jgi:hypothetical protein
MKKIAFYITILIIYTATLKWFIPIRIRLNFFEIFIVLFLLVFFLINKHQFKLPAALIQFIHLQWALFGVLVLSSIAIPFSVIGISLFILLKGLLQSWCTLFIFQH